MPGEDVELIKTEKRRDRLRGLAITAGGSSKRGVFPRTKKNLLEILGNKGKTVTAQRSKGGGNGGGGSSEQRASRDGKLYGRQKSWLSRGTGNRMDSALRGGYLGGVGQGASV